MTREKRERAPIHITIADIERAYKKVEEFRSLLEKCKTKEQIFKDMLKLIGIDK